MADSIGALILLIVEMVRRLFAAGISEIPDMQQGSVGCLAPTDRDAGRQQ